MAQGKAKFINDCARLIERRVALLELELDGVGQKQSEQAQACDRAAILEARHLANLIRSLAEGPYFGHPHDVARGRTGFGPKVS